MNYSLLQETGDYLLLEDSSHILLDNYLYFTIQKSLQYLLTTQVTHPVKQLDVIYAVSTSEQITKDLIYKLYVQNIKQKVIDYKIITTGSLSKDLDYKVITSNLQSLSTGYKIIKPYSQQKDILYRVYASHLLTKDIQYGIYTVQTKQKQIEYGIVILHTISKNIQYRVYAQNLLTLPVKYAVDYAFKRLRQLSMVYKIGIGGYSYYYDYKSTDWDYTQSQKYNRFVLLETGDYVLLENSGKIVLEGDRETTGWSGYYASSGGSWSYVYTPK
jgi:hypothetical protein